MADSPRKRTDTTDGSKGQQTRERLLEAAAAILTEKGYSGTRLGDIAKRAELQAPAIYYYYDSREALIEDVVRRGQQSAQAHVENALAQLPDGTPFLERIRCAVEEHLRVVLNLSDFTTAAIRNMGQLPEAMRKQIRSDHKSYGELWQRLFEEAQSNGEIRGDVDVTAARLLIIGALNWSPEWWSTRVADIDDVVAAAIALTDGLIARP
ncbi:TetR family transcriptional regulator [Prauserella sp. PE36]|uniref:TetR/AcrR family transcriptional regulator n=1 Tax=Prauserella endophytica TaxID=1592324 RepID=A0ABY2RU40_9PSEU|nr:MULTISPECIES: TetR/AcrR family transcriptional regulator [Prauserella]RBM10691.1 TetR family transcriptional regulator [Prauserella sp. PE36]TKG60615.1 TetR/AcrR family transcriptional regulator [Prauserella endophytica]